MKLLACLYQVVCDVRRSCESGRDTFHSGSPRAILSQLQQSQRGRSHCWRPQQDWSTQPRTLQQRGRGRRGRPPARAVTSLPRPLPAGGSPPTALCSHRHLPPLPKSSVALEYPGDSSHNTESHIKCQNRIFSTLGLSHH